MSDHSSLQDAQPLAVQIEVVGADERNPDPAAVGGVAREIAGTLRDEGYAVSPAYSGRRDGTVYDVAVQVAQYIQDNKEVLAALAGVATPIIQLVAKKLGEKPAQKQPSPGKDQAPPAEITVQVNGTVVRIDTTQVPSDAEVLEQLVLGTRDLATPIGPGSDVKISVSVPAHTPRRRR